MTCYVRRKLSPNPAYPEWQARFQMLARDSKHMPVSAGLFGRACEPANCMILIPCVRSARVAAGSSWLASGAPPPVARARVTNSDRCDPIQVAAPEWLPRAACTNVPGASCISTDPRAPGRPWATAEALSSHGHMWRGSSSLRHRCVAGHGHALRLVQLAA